MRRGVCFFAILALPGVLSAQLLPDQRVLDFQDLVALYAKRYAPYQWKNQALGFDLFNIQPWMDRVKAAKDDLEFFEIQAEYVANLNDTHSGFSMTSTFRANLGMTVDIYDGKVLIDSITRSALPAKDYPFQVGDELVSVDDKSAEDWIKRISTWRRYGNPMTTRRIAAGEITARVQSVFPRAVEIGDSAKAVIRRASGDLETYTIPWTKAGIPVTTVGPVPFFKALHKNEAAETFDPETVAGSDHNWSLPENDPARYLNGIGSPVPVFRAGFPSNFVQRLGRLPADFHYSGTYQAGGFNIGYLRIPSFAPPSTALALLELNNEIGFLQRNTDGLVLDVSRNPGGGCYMIDVTARLMSSPFYFFGEQIRATQDRLNSFQSLMETAKANRAAQWVVDTYQVYIDAMKQALGANRALTGPIAACAETGSGWAPVMNGNLPAAVVYSKPMIVLIDEASISAGEIFAAMIQDNGRAPLVGARTSGGGGSISQWETGFYSESVASNTNTLVVRKNPIQTPDFPEAPYVENIGVRPDVPLDCMTKENLLNGGQTCVNAFTDVLVDAIKKSR